MERDGIRDTLRGLAEMACSGEGSFVKTELQIRKLLAEFDKLKAENLGLCYKLKETQSWLGEISDPIVQWLKSIPPVDKTWDEHKSSFAYKSLEMTLAYLDSQSEDALGAGGISGGLKEGKK